MNKEQQELIKEVEKRKEQYIKIAKDIFNHPETCNNEYFASELLSNTLKNEGFEVQNNIAGHATGFLAKKKGIKKGPIIAFLAEYDALENLGHACGHHLIGSISVLAAVALSKKIDDLCGEIWVFGTPGEEGGNNGSAKESYVRDGYFKNVDVAMMVHPSTKHTLTPKSLALDPINIEFFGKASHAGSAPEKGVNALDALILTYNGINALRQHVTNDVKIHGIITNGGSAPNIVPDYASAKFYVRASTREGVDLVTKKIRNIVEGAALATGSTFKIQRYQNKVDNLIPNEKLDKVYQRNLESIGEVLSVDPSFGSTDAGNVSHVVPTLHACLKSMEINAPGHTIEFKNACTLDFAMDSIVIGAKALSLTALELFNNQQLVEEIKQNHIRKNI
jgi:amidohydrolase